MNNRIFAIILFMLSCVPARAAFEDMPFGARGMGLAGSFTAFGGLDAVMTNPAVTGEKRKFDSETAFFSSFRTPQGDADLRRYTFVSAFPRMLHGRNGSISLAASYRQNPSFSKEKLVQMGYGTWHLLPVSYGVFDFGLNLKVLSLESIPSGQSQMSLSADFGAVLRISGGKRIGVSFLNINNPSFDVVDFSDNAPFVFKLGYAEEMPDYNLSADFSRRSGSSFSDRSYTFSAGFEYFWRFVERGRISSYSGLMLGDNSSAFSLGAGYKISAGKISYAVQVPLTRSLKLGHAVSLNLRFGAGGVESEYEKMIKREVKYRKDLLRALDESARREAILRDEIDSLKKETDELREMLEAKARESEAHKKEKARLERILEKRKEAAKRLKELREKRKRDRIRQLEFSFSRDFQSYLKLKASSPPREVLKGMLERIVREYQGQGIDISRATMELRKILSSEE